MDLVAAAVPVREEKKKSEGKGSAAHHQTTSMGAEDKEKNCVYICFPFSIETNYGWNWVILNMENDESFPSPLLRMEWEFCNLAFASVSLGSTIYVIGGFFSSHDPSKDSVTSDRVSYYDTCRPHGDWKDANPMIHPRRFPSAVALDGKIYVFGGPFPGEVFDSDKGTWKLLQVPPVCTTSGDLYVDEVVLSDPSNGRIIVRFPSSGSLYAYYPAPALWKCLKLDFPSLFSPSVVVDDVLYTAIPAYRDHTRCLLSYDLVSNQYLDTVWSNDEDFNFPGIIHVYQWDVLLHLGNGKLCMTMHGRVRAEQETIAVRCLKFHVHKEPGGKKVLQTQPSFHEFRFRAGPAGSLLKGFLTL